MEQQTGSKLGKDYVKAIYCHPAYLTYIRVHYVKCWAGWIPSWNQDCREKYQQLQICRWYHFNGRKRRGTKEPLDESEREEWKSWLKTQYLKKKKLRLWHPASSLITSWQIEEGTLEAETDFIFFGCKITADSDCSHEIKNFPSKEQASVTNLDSVSKSRNTTFPTKVHIVKAMVFTVVMYGCESWTTEKAERQRIDAFQW